MLVIVHNLRASFNNLNDNNALVTSRRTFFSAVRFLGEATVATFFWKRGGKWQAHGASTSTHGLRKV